MPDRPDDTFVAAALRRQAEARWRAQTAALGATAPADAAALLHELQVHQIELEMQNEELRRAQSALEVSRARYFELYDRAPVGYLTLSEAGLVIEVNLTAALLLGVARAAVVSRPLSAFVIREDQDTWYRHFRELLTSPGPVAWEMRFERAGGAPFWARLEGGMAPGTLGAERVCLLTASNVAARKNAEAALAESQRLLQLAQVVAGLGTYVLTFATGTWESSPVLDAIFGIDGNYPRTVDGWTALVHPEDRAAMVDYLATEVVGRRRRFDREYRIVRARDGEERWVHGYGDLDLKPGGELVAMVGAIQDITDRKRAEEQIGILNAGLEQQVQQRTGELGVANTELEAFSYSVSHDLRAPLRAIDGFSAMLIEDCGANLDDEGRRLLAVIRGNVQKMSRLIDDLLAFSRVGRGEVLPTRVAMGELVRSVYDEVVADPAARDRIDFTIGELPAVDGDAALLRIVWVNLLSNAVKFSSRKARVAIEVSGERDGDQLVFHVRDNGAGFDGQYVGKLFGVFQRLHATCEFDGTGIGLALVRRIVARHGGKVWAQGAVGEGAEFSFSLPLKAPAST